MEKGIKHAETEHGIAFRPELGEEEYGRTYREDGWEISRDEY
jgi:hypothetical protein